MTRTIRVHFDGKTLVPEEPVELPVNQAFAIPVPSSHNPADQFADVEDYIRFLDEGAGRITGNEPIPNEALRREYLYDDRW